MAADLKRKLSNRDVGVVLLPKKLALEVKLVRRRLRTDPALLNEPVKT